MKKSIFILSLLFCGGLNAQTSLKQVPGEYIVHIKGNIITPLILQTKNASTDRTANFKNTSALRKRLEEQLLEIAKRNDIPRPANLFVDATVAMHLKNVSEDIVKRISADPAVESVTPNFSFQIPMLNEKLVKVYDQETTCATTSAGGSLDGSKKRTWIWILDTGIDVDHPDLNVQTTFDFAKSFIDGETVDDENGHGTHVAGIAAAKNNFVGVVGVSAGAMVVPVKVLDKTNRGSWASILGGLNHVASRVIPNDVVNMSLGAGLSSSTKCEDAQPGIRDAILNLGKAGTFIVMTSGNAGNCVGSDNNFPGCINGANIFTVASMTCEKSCSGFSNWGNQSVDWVAVGSLVNSTFMNGTYATLSGTSMAAPVVAGIIHAKGRGPVSAGNIICCKGSYRIARH